MSSEEEDTAKGAAEEDITEEEDEYYKKYAPPPAPTELPERFLGAGKGDPVEGQRRYEETLKWRQEYDMNFVLRKPCPNFEICKKSFTGYFHLRGKENEPVWYEHSTKVKLKELRKEGVDCDELVKYYAMITEFGWQYLEPDDSAKSITVLDLDGLGMMDFVGDVVDFTRKASNFTGQHYPERSKYILVINVPSWFQIIWKVVSTFVDEVTQKKIKILKKNKQEILDAMKEIIPIENIPPEYGGTSMPLGESPEEKKLVEFFTFNNNNNMAEESSDDDNNNNPLYTWKPSRAY